MLVVVSDPKMLVGMFHRESNPFLGSSLVGDGEVGSMVNARDPMVVTCEVDSRFPVVSGQL